MIQETDAVVIGAGPAGLFLVFQLGLQGLRAHVVDALSQAGGQCAELYGDKPIYDIPGIPVCTGRELSDRLFAQTTPFRAQWHWNTLVSGVEPAHHGRWLVHTNQGQQLLARAVFIAAGVGAFVPRTPSLHGLDALVGSQVFYQHLPKGAEIAGQHVVVHGGDAAAVACAVALASKPVGTEAPASVALLHRRDVFQAPPEQLAQLQALRAAGRLHIVVAQITNLHTHNDRLTGLQLANPDGTTADLRTDTLVVALGLSPRLGPLADWGLAMERKQLAVDPATLGTNLPGVYALGDVVTYPGKRKLIVCSFHEATLAALAAAERLSGQAVLLQYTSSSTLLQQRLGVAPTKPAEHAMPPYA